jgi:hypothetical protein
MFTILRTPIVDPSLKVVFTAKFKGEDEILTNISSRCCSVVAKKTTWADYVPEQSTR